MSRSYLKSKYIKSKMDKGISYLYRRNHHHYDEMPKNSPSKYITTHCSNDVSHIQESTSFGGHSIPKGGHRIVSGIVRANVKREIREEIESQMNEG